MNTQQPIRQHRWRIGLFLGLTFLGLLFGWGITKRLFVGIITPTLETSSGMSIRITPEHALWFATHTNGLAINTSCPMDIPTLISLKHPSWIVLGDTGSATTVTLKGNLPTSLKNYKKAFGCTITSAKNSYTFQETSGKIPRITSTFSPTTPDGWAWTTNGMVALELFEHGLNVLFKNLTPQNPTPWPEQNLVTALPFTKAAFNIFPQTWQGLADLFVSEQGIAFFTWEEDQKTAQALSLKGDITNDMIVSLFYDIGDIPTTAEKEFREDDFSYVVVKKPELILTWINETQGEIRLKNESVVGYVVKQDTFTLVSTKKTTWGTNTPYWEAPLINNTNKMSHRALTLVNFGEKMFATKKKLTVFQE